MSDTNCYGDGTVFEGVRSKDSVIHTWRLAIGEVYPGHAVIHGPSFKLDCFLTASDLGQNDYEKRIADLRLIAAAPDLYKALEKTADHIEAMMAHIEHKPVRFKEHCWQQALEARAALAKARGESNA